VADQPLRILIVRIGAMGDVLHGMPAVAGLRTALPGCRIGWAVEPRWAPLLVASTGEMPLVDRVHLVPTKEWKRHPLAAQTLRGIAELRREIRAEQYDVAIDLQGSIKSAVAGRLAAAKTFLGSNAPREQAARLLYTHRIRPTTVSVIQQASELIEAGARRWLEQAAVSRLEPAGVVLPVEPEAERWCDTVIERESLPPVFLVPQAGWGAKEWGAANYAELAKRLMSAGFRILINQPPGMRLPEALKPVEGAIAVESTLPQMIALARRASLVIGGDTGPVHLAAALGTPVVALFGPTDPARNGPHFPGARVRVLRDPSSVTDHRRHPDTEAGLKRIRVEEVLDAALNLLGDRKQGA
jgi:heptosyltransferase-1